MRCRPRETEPGDSTWNTRSPAPMSMPELERRRRHEPLQRSLLQRVLDLEALLAGDRAVVRGDEVLAGQLVQTRGQPLGQTPGVHEDEVERCARTSWSSSGHRRPDAGALGPCGRGAAAEPVGRLADLRHVLHRDDDLDLHRLTVTRVDDRDGPGSVGREPAEEPRGSPRAVAASPRGRSAGAGSSRSPRVARADTARCAPRFVAAIACISSTMTQRTLRRISRARDVSMRNS